MKRFHLPLLHIPLRRNHLTITLDPSWLLILPGGMWIIAAFYVQVMGAYLNPVQTWLVTFLILVLVVIALAGHLLGHLLAARRLGCELPPNLPLLVYGDAAQGWPAATSSRREALAALSGQLANLLLAGLAFLVWNAQLNPYLNLSMLFACLFNIWLVLINLIPAFPLDGGRLVQAIMRFRSSRQKVLWPGYLIALALAGWGILLISQGARYSWQTGALTIGFAGLLVIGLRLQPAWQGEWPAHANPSTGFRKFARSLLAGVLISALLAFPAGLLLLNHSLEAPGFALSVEPMVSVPDQYRHSHSGTFILTSVLSQEPILAGEWLAGKLTSAIKVIPPARRQPNEPSPQETARQGFQMLDQSETTAVAVGLRLAGFPASVVGKGVRIISVLPESPSQGLLKPDDVITALNGGPIRTTDELIAQIKAQDPQSRVTLHLQRAQAEIDVTVPLMAPAQPGGPPRLGITIDSAGIDYSLPFPVKITPQKIVGGPSAGLMFTLTVYNQVTPDDLTGGRKIAGTGTINPDGTVGPIGGVEQKVVAAELAGAEYFLSPPDNFEAAQAVARRIKVIKIASAKEAIAFLKSLNVKP